MDLFSNPEYPVIDGFLLDARLRCNLGFRALALAQFESLRRSGAYRSMMWCVPKDSSSNQVIKAFTEHKQTLNMIPGSVLWGFIFSIGSNAGPFSFQAEDGCTGVKLFSEVIRADQFVFGSFTGGYGMGPTPYQKLFGRLMTIAHQGIVSVEICSQQTTDATGVQLVLCGAEPVAPSQCSSS